MRTLLAIFISTLLAWGACAQSQLPDHTIAINGITTHYTVSGQAAHGTKPAAILVHGNGGSYASMLPSLEVMAKAGYEVYALDSRGQGQNEPLSEYHYADMASDVNAFIAAMGLKKPVVLGFSDGGIIALLLAIAHPENVGAIATCGANTVPEGVLPEVYAQFKASIDNALAKGETIPALTKMMLDEPHITAQQLQGIKVPALIMAGENDLIDPDHTFHIARSIKGSTLMIVGGADHGSYVNDGRAATFFVNYLNTLK